MLPEDILFLAFHYSSWDMLEQIALMNSYHLSCVQHYLHTYPRRINDLMVLMRLFPHATWDYCYLSANPNITTLFVENVIKYLADAPYPLNLNNIFDSVKIARNSAVTWELVCKYPLVPWNWKALTSNPNITWDIINAHPNKDWDRHAAYDKFLDASPCEIHPQSYAGIMGFTFVRGSDRCMGFMGPLGPSSGCTGATGPRGYNNISTRDNGEPLEVLRLRNEDLIGLRNEDLTWDIVYSNRHLNWSFRELSKNPFSARQKR